MNAYINYLIEANLSLALLLTAYIILLRKETDFKKKRLFMLVGIIASLLFPFLHFQNGSIQSIPSISTIVSAYWLPEITIAGEQTGQSLPANNTLSDVWNYLQWTYVTILLFFLIRFLIQLIGLIRTIAKSKGYTLHGFHIVESNESHPTFSFFNFIFIGQALSLSADDKNKIVQHEAVHAQQLHSIDIILLNVLGIFFWFNPLIRSYKKIFVQLHEFEADARTVDNTEVNDYCKLLAKVALQSADYPLANYFNQSLTLKRIEMMRTLKEKIKPWKLVSLFSVIVFLFFVVACQDQLADINEITTNSTSALVVPDNVQARFEQLKKEDPNSKYILVEFNETAEQKLAEMEKTYGLPKHIELFTPEYKNPIIGDAAEIHISTSLAEKNGLQTFAIIKYNEMTAKLFESSKQEGDVFSIVEEPATPKGGMPVFHQYISENLDYPVDAKKSGTQGKVFIEFIVNADGSISDLRILKGIGKGCDEEALRVMSASPAWIPAKLNGKFVRQKMVMPLNFQLG